MDVRRRSLEPKNVGDDRVAAIDSVMAKRRDRRLRVHRMVLSEASSTVLLQYASRPPCAFMALLNRRQEVVDHRRSDTGDRQVASEHRQSAWSWVDRPAQ